MKFKKIIKNILIGFICGIISGFFGSGGGLLLLPYMTKFLKKNEIESRATTIFCIFFMVLSSSIIYFKSNYINIESSIKCAISGAIGGYIGSKILWKINTKKLKLLFIIFLVYTSFKMIIR